MRFLNHIRHLRAHEIEVPSACNQVILIFKFLKNPSLSLFIFEGNYALKRIKLDLGIRFLGEWHFLMELEKCF